MKLIFYKRFELAQVLDFSLQKNKKTIFVAQKDFITLLKCYFNHLHENNHLIYKTIIFYQNNFSIKYFIELINNFNSPIISQFFHFIEKNLINSNFNISHILNHPRLSSELNDFIQKIILFSNQLEIFFYSPPSIFNNFFEKHILLIKLLQDICLTQLEEELITNNSKYAISINTYIEYIKHNHNNTQNFCKLHENVFFIPLEDFSDDLFDQNLFFFLNNELELSIFEKIIPQKQYKSELFLFLTDNLRDYADRIQIDHYNDNKNYFESYTFDSQKKNLSSNIIHKERLSSKQEKTENLLKFYQKLSLETLDKSSIIKINQNGLKRLLNNKESFIKKDILALNLVSKVNEESLLDGYFDYYIEQIIKKYINQKTHLSEIIHQVLNKSIDKSYIEYVTCRIEPLIQNFLKSYSHLLSSEFIYEDIEQNLQFKDKTIELKNSIFCIIKNQEEIILYDISSKTISIKDFESFKRPSAIAVGMHLLEKYPNHQISIRCCNLDNDGKEIVIEDPIELIKRLRISIFEKIKNLYILND